MERIGNNIPSYMSQRGDMLSAHYIKETGMEYAVYLIDDENEARVYVEACHEDIGQVTWFRATVAEAYALTNV